MMHRLVFSLLAVALGLVVAAPALAQPADPLVKVATDPQLGKILVDSKGMTLYLYSRDTKGMSNCYNQCETNWPILRPPASRDCWGRAAHRVRAAICCVGPDRIRLVRWLRSGNLTSRAHWPRKIC